MCAYNWGRLYGKWADDIDVQSMSEADQRRHAMLLCMHIKGHLNPTDEEVTLQLRISKKSWKKTKEIFIEKGFIADDSNHLINWERRQFKSDKSAERTREYRNRTGTNDENVTSQARHSDGHGDESATPSEYRVQNTETEEEYIPPSARAVDAGEAAKLLKAVNSAYAEILPGMPEALIPTSVMHHNLCLNMESFQERRTLVFWRDLFHRVRGSPWLMGEVNGKDGRPFACCLDWLLKPDNVADILNRKYHSAPQKPGQGDKSRKEHSSGVRKIGDS